MASATSAAATSSHSRCLAKFKLALSWTIHLALGPFMIRFPGLAAKTRPNREEPRVKRFRCCGFRRF
ncbi:hypothetical protein PAHAL_2G050400 [Panicum hallii]|uniref:Uncharacterized protein n=1 Tax=Panicum hallii TaxID=206008 RepID=A0A2T8KMU6_9POAL|nr:hypothetical protein PAHAL_2G041900 [Panicum hallii]PVH63538.1 hypothetical protein PAHAL_2G050400 [Panicum hallii]